MAEMTTIPQGTMSKVHKSIYPCLTSKKSFDLDLKANFQKKFFINGLMVIMDGPKTIVRNLTIFKNFFFQKL
jgi:hypothetical protein